MDYYVTKKAGSILLRSPSKLHALAGQHIPVAHWQALPADVRARMIADGSVQGFEDPDSVRLPEPPKEALPGVGVRKDEFMPEARVLRGERRDAALEALIAEQKARSQKAREDSEVDQEAGGSADGVVQVELPQEDEGDEDFDELSDEDLDIVRDLEREED